MSSLQPRAAAEQALSARFPPELMYMILVYAGYVKWRNGAFMGQIPPRDRRYRLLRTIPLPRLQWWFDEDYYYKVTVQFVRLDRTLTLYEGEPYDVYIWRSTKAGGTYDEYRSGYARRERKKHGSVEDSSASRDFTDELDG